MAADTVWVPAYNARVQFGTTYLECTTASLKASLNKFDTDNTEGGIFHEFGIDKMTASLTCTVAVSEDNIANIPKLGKSATATWAETATGGVSHAGTGRVTDITKTGGGKGGYTYQLTIDFSGPITNLLDASVYTPPGP